MNTITNTRARLNILFLCTGNSARSILFECLLNHFGGQRFQAFSAGSQPAGRVNPFALQVLEKAGISTEGLRSKSWDEFAQADAPPMDLIITVCDNAAGETCPYWPGQPATAHWGYPDPAAVQGSDSEKLAAFEQTLRAIKQRLDIFLSLPFEKLDRLSLQQE
ncbi:MAG: arsenate reductase ArsC, partial [bacterium]